MISFQAAWLPDIVAKVKVDPEDIPKKWWHFFRRHPMAGHEPSI
jgi:hypothetical protein